MKQFTLAEGLYVFPSPGGAYYAVSARERNPTRNVLQSLLKMEWTPRLTLEGLKAWSGIEDSEQALRLLYHAQGLNWVEGFESPLNCRNQPLEQLLPGLLETLSAHGKALLADGQGFYLASHGFAHEVAEELSALSAELANLNERRSGVLAKNLGLGTSAWGVVNASGNSQIGFWPLYVGKHRFTLVVSGLPHFNQPDFVQLIWTLCMRYAASDR